ncbi:MAG TPA: ribose-phosphate diphosphokinase [Burkholderiales bacterium]|jgi:ribose-phosphate pyrophosphokinase|nr:ribose-phosphate diphosphokinase [Burkholderiales bacterium]HEX2650149.1 ribose-phosphate diphosphokinase [Burkholderiales bacterium]
MSLLVCALPGNERYSAKLRARLGARTLRLETRAFPDGESYVRLAGECRGRDIAFVCTLNDPDPKFLGLLFAARAARELGARRIGLVAPYLAYMRQDKRFREGEAISSATFAALASEAFDWLVTVDPHLHRHASLGEIYSIPAEAAASAGVLSAWIRAHVRRPLIIGPDIESARWAGAVADGARAPVVVLEKRRRGDRDVRISLPDLSRWRDHTPVLVDDIISSGVTMARAAARLRAQRFAAPVCAAVHAVFASGARERLEAAGCRVIATTDTITDASNRMSTVALVAEAVKRVRARRK